MVHNVVYIASLADDALAAIRCFEETGNKAYLEVAKERLTVIEEKTLDVLPQARRQSK